MLEQHNCLFSIAFVFLRNKMENIFICIVRSGYLTKEHEKKVKSCSRHLYSVVEMYRRCSIGGYSCLLNISINHNCRHPDIIHPTVMKVGRFCFMNQYMLSQRRRSLKSYITHAHLPVPRFPLDFSLVHTSQKGWGVVTNSIIVRNENVMVRKIPLYPFYPNS